MFGYHDIGAAGLRELLTCGADVATVVTHRNDPGEQIWFESVADLAAARGIPVLMPEDPNAAACVEAIRRLRPDLIVSLYYRRMLAPAILAIPPLGAVNVHGSLLPKYRGRAPLNWVLVNGEALTGVTLHHMDDRADHGDIIGQRAVPIAVEDTALTLWRKLTLAACQVLAETYPLLASGQAPRMPQDHSQATKFGRRTPADGQVDWTQSAWQIYNLIRAVTRPFPGAFSFWQDERIFLWSARPPSGRRVGAPPGTVEGVGSDGAIEVATGDGLLCIDRVQPAGGPEMSGAEFVARGSRAGTIRFTPAATPAIDRKGEVR